MDKIIVDGYPDTRIVGRKDLEDLSQDNTLTNTQKNPGCYTIQIMALKYPRKPSYFSNLDMVRRY
jgi:hypothetical protein